MSGVYYPPSVPVAPEDMPQIAVYGRITTPRRCVELVLLALEHLASQGVQFTAHLFGADIDEAAAPFLCFVYGILAPAALGDLYRRCAVGICLSGTNYSLVPQEMMACGLPVLELDAPSTRAVFPDGVVTRAGGHPVQIAVALEEMLRSPERRKCQADAALDWLAGTTWERSARSIEQAIQERLAERGHPKQPTPKQPATKHQTLAQKHPPGQKPYATVCIPTWNGGKTLARVIQRIEEQRCPWAFRIVVMDSSSDDGSIESLPASDRLTVKVIDKAEFQHGRTRNWLARMARGEFVVFLTQDACPADEFWLYNLVTTLEHYPKAGGAFGRHRAWPDASPFTRRDIDSHFDRFDYHPLAVSRDTDVQKWSSGDEGWRQMLHFFSDNNSCIRRSVWQRYPLPEIDYGEDQVWADGIISSGLQRVYAPGAVVYHSHDYRARELQARAETEVRFFRQQFGYRMFDDSVPLDAQIAAKNAADEYWARANGVDADALARRLQANAFWLQGAARGLRDGNLASLRLQDRKTVRGRRRSAVG